MTLSILTAVADASWEADLVAGLEDPKHDVTVVRRCVDVADLLAAAATRTAEAVVLSADLRRLDRDALGRLAAAGVAVVGLVEPGDDEAERRLRQLGVAKVLPSDAGLMAIATALQAAVSDAQRDAKQAISATSNGASTVAGLADPGAALPWLGDLDEPAPPPPGAGRVVAVWGPNGAPGRTTLAIGIADEASRLGVPTLLVDADTYGGCVAQVLGFLDESPGLAAAARLAGSGRLDLPALTALARTTSSRLRVLTGIARADRWPELSGDAVASVLELCREVADLVVIDCGFSLEQDEEIVYDTAAPRRNAATIAALEAADTIVVVGAADPVGLHRLVRGLADVRELSPGGRLRVVVNKVRRGITPGDPHAEAAAALLRHAGIRDAAFLPYDRAALDRSLGAGRSLAEMAPSSGLRRALLELAAEQGGVAVPPARGRRRRAAG